MHEATELSHDNAAHRFPVPVERVIVRDGSVVFPKGERYEGERPRPSGGERACSR